MKYRTKQDSVGAIRVANKNYWGSQTQRSIENFKIGEDRFPPEMIRAFGILKKAAALTNSELGDLGELKRDLITKACNEIITGKLHDQFPLVVWQTGSGTQTNMNFNEVIANRAIELAGGVKGSKNPIHLNDDVNMSQSSNDTFPTAMHIEAVEQIETHLLLSLDNLIDTFEAKIVEFKPIVKIGRTHLMDATPITLSQEFSGYLAQLKNGKKWIEQSSDYLRELAMGATAVGTGLNTHPGYAELVTKHISHISGHKFRTAANKFESIAAHDAIVGTSGAIKRLACSVFKIVNDIRLLASGPRCGLGEIILPPNEPGSSIMPGKVNPTQCEALSMVCIQVMGNDTAISFAGSQGNLELNVYKPLMIHNLLHSIRILGDGLLSFNDKCLIGIQADKGNIDKHLKNSLMLVTALNPYIGYDKTSQVVDFALERGFTLRESVVEMGIMDGAEFDKIVDPKKMTN